MNEQDRADVAALLQIRRERLSLQPCIGSVEGWDVFSMRHVGNGPTIASALQAYIHDQATSRADLDPYRSDPCAAILERSDQDRADAVAKILANDDSTTGPKWACLKAIEGLVGGDAIVALRDVVTKIEAKWPGQIIELSCDDDHAASSSLWLITHERSTDKLWIHGTITVVYIAQLGGHPPAVFSLCDAEACDLRRALELLWKRRVRSYTFEEYDDDEIAELLGKQYVADTDLRSTTREAPDTDSAREERLAELVETVKFYAERVRDAEHEHIRLDEIRKLAATLIQATDDGIQLVGAEHLRSRLMLAAKLNGKIHGPLPAPQEIHRDPDQSDDVSKLQTRITELEGELEATERSHEQIRTRAKQAERERDMWKHEAAVASEDERWVPAAAPEGQAAVPVGAPVGPGDARLRDALTQARIILADVSGWSTCWARFGGTKTDALAYIDKALAAAPLSGGVVREAGSDVPDVVVQLGALRRALHAERNLLMDAHDLGQVHDEQRLRRVDDALDRLDAMQLVLEGREPPAAPQAPGVVRQRWLCSYCGCSDLDKRSSCAQCTVPRRPALSRADPQAEAAEPRPALVVPYTEDDRERDKAARRDLVQPTATRRISQAEAAEPDHVTRQTTEPEMSGLIERLQAELDDIEAMRGGSVPVLGESLPEYAACGVPCSYDTWRTVWRLRRILDTPATSTTEEAAR